MVAQLAAVDTAAADCRALSAARRAPAQSPLRGVCCAQLVAPPAACLRLWCGDFCSVLLCFVFACTVTRICSGRTILFTRCNIRGRQRCTIWVFPFFSKRSHFSRAILCFFPSPLPSPAYKYRIPHSAPPLPPCSIPTAPQVASLFAEVYAAAHQPELAARYLDSAANAARRTQWTAPH